MCLDQYANVVTVTGLAFYQVRHPEICEELYLARRDWKGLASLLGILSETKRGAAGESPGPQSWLRFQLRRSFAHPGARLTQSL